MLVIAGSGKLKQEDKENLLEFGDQQSTYVCLPVCLSLSIYLSVCLSV